MSLVKLSILSISVVIIVILTSYPVYARRGGGRGGGYRGAGFASRPKFMDPMMNPKINPLVNPKINPLANPQINPMANPKINPWVNPMINPAGPRLNPLPPAGQYQGGWGQNLFPGQWHP